MVYVVWRRTSGVLYCVSPAVLSAHISHSPFFSSQGFQSRGAFSDAVVKPDNQPPLGRVRHARGP